MSSYERWFLQDGQGRQAAALRQVFLASHFGSEHTTRISSLRRQIKCGAEQGKRTSEEKVPGNLNSAQSQRMTVVSARIPFFLDIHLYGHL